MSAPERSRSPGLRPVRDPPETARTPLTRSVSIPSDAANSRLAPPGRSRRVRSGPQPALWGPNKTMPARYPSAIVTSWRTSWRKISYFCRGSRTAWLASRLGRFHALDRSWFDVPPRVVETRGCGLIPKPMPDEAPATSSSRPAKDARGTRVGARALVVRARASTALVAGAPAPLGTASTIPSARCRGEVRSRAPVSLGSCTDARRAAVQPPSSSGRGRRPFKAVTRVRIPLGVLRSLQIRSAGDGPVGCASPTRGAVTDHEFVRCSLVGWGHRPAGGGGETSSSRMWQHPSAGRRSPLLRGTHTCERWNKQQSRRRGE